MKNHVVVFFCAVLALSAAGISCKTADTERAAPSPAPDIFHAVLPAVPSAPAPEISTADLQVILAAGSAVVFDARPFREFAVSHIPGAVNLAAKPGVSKALYVSDVAEVGRVVGDNKAAPVVLYCNGPYCGKAVRLAAELAEAGYTDVKRYQLGIPIWRALGGLTQIEKDGVLYVREQDRTAVLIDARDDEAFQAGSLLFARSVPAAELKAGKDQGVMLAAKNDGRLPVEDHNTRIIVFGADGAQARLVAEAIAKEAFHNVAFFDGDWEELR